MKNTISPCGSTNRNTANAATELSANVSHRKPGSQRLKEVTATAATKNTN